MASVAFITMGGITPLLQTLKELENRGIPGEILTTNYLIKEFEQLWDSEYVLNYDQFFGLYKERYQIIKHQREIAKREQISSLECYRLQPNSMQVGFITNLKNIIDAHEKRHCLFQPQEHDLY